MVRHKLRRSTSGSPAKIKDKDLGLNNIACEAFSYSGIDNGACLIIS